MMKNTLVAHKQHCWVCQTCVMILHLLAMDIATTSTQRMNAGCPRVHLGKTAGEEISIYPSTHTDIVSPILCL